MESFTVAFIYLSIKLCCKQSFIYANHKLGEVHQYTLGVKIHLHVHIELWGYNLWSDVTSPVCMQIYM